MPLKISKIVIAVLAVIISIYPAAYFIWGPKFGLLQSKSDAVLASVPYNASFYIHIIGGGIALLTGWSQFNKRIRSQRISLHRNTGKIYIISVLLSATAGMYIAFYANGGIIASAGFFFLGLVWFSTTLQAYISIKAKNIFLHEKMMVYSYAACFAAVTLRLYMPLLTILFHDSIKAYQLVAWLCWLPNLLVAYFIAKRIKKNSENNVPSSPAIFR